MLVAKTQKNKVFKGNYLLKLISNNEQVIIKPTDGVDKIAYQLLPGEKYSSNFKWIDPDFTKLADNQLIIPTDAIEVDVFRLKSTATFQEMIDSIRSEKDELCLSQAQIIDFCVNQKAYLEKVSYGTIFLLKSLNEYFIVRAIIGSEKKIIFRLHPFGSETKWDCKLSINLVVPAFL